MKVFLILGILSSLLFFGGGIALGVYDIFVIEDGTWFIVGLMSAAVGAIGLWISIKALFSEIAEEKRLRQERGDDFVNARNKNTNTMLKRMGLIWLVLFVVISIPLAIYLFTSDDSGAEGCRNCGRTEDLVPGFGYCEDCFDGFIDWQDRTWTED